MIEIVHYFNQYNIEDLIDIFLDKEFLMTLTPEQFKNINQNNTQIYEAEHHNIFL